MASNAAAISVPEGARSQLKTILRHLAKIPDIFAAAKKHGPGITGFQIISPLAEELKIEYRDLEDIFYGLENLRQIVDEFGTADDALTRVEAAVDPDLARDLNKERGRLEQAINSYRDSPAETTIKTQRLAYTHERILRGAEIITDSRPIYNTKGDEIVQFIISHTLVVTQRDSRGTAQFHFEMDAADVVDLRELCDRAIVKANVLKRTLTEANPKLKVHVLRDDDAS